MLAGHVAEAVAVLGPVTVEADGAVLTPLEDKPAARGRVHVAPDGHWAAGGGGLDVVHPAPLVAAREDSRAVCTRRNNNNNRIRHVSSGVVVTVTPTKNCSLADSFLDPLA